MNDFASRLLQIRPYDEGSFRARFENDPIVGMLPAGVIPVWARSGTYDHAHHASTTPRWRHMHGYFCMASFYYLQFVMEGNPGSVADIGCGENIFKRFYPQITGYDPFIEAADHMSYFDDQFVEANREAFDCAMACNSIHFTGVHEFPAMLGRLAGLVRPGGMVHATVNTMRFLDAMHPDNDVVHSKEDCVGMALVLDETIRSMGLDLVVLDQCYNGIYPGELEFNNGVLGNVRLVFRV